MSKIRRGPIGLRTKVVIDAIGQPMVVSDGILGVAFRGLTLALRSSNPVLTAAVSAAVSASVSAGVTYWMANESNVAARAESYKTDARELLCEVSPHNSKLFICQVNVSAQNQGVAGANNGAVSNANTDEQLALDGSKEALK